MKAIALISGGLDSVLAARLIQDQGIVVIPLNFKIPFGHKNKRSSISQADIASRNLKRELKTVNLDEEFLEVIKNPRYGFGSNMNPCIDCKILMLAKAKELMPKLKAAFVITGEVLGQRPMSQHKQALKIIEQRSSLEGLVLRPLSAKLLPETIPEKEGWVDRSRLLNFSGRSRKPQMGLAKVLDIKDYPNPAGGCLLTDPQFAQRLKELLLHAELNIENIKLLKLGRHFRIAQDTKLVLGRDEKENGQLVHLAKEKDYLFFPTEDLAGPTALGRGNFNEELIKLACAITCRYCDSNGTMETEIVYKQIPGNEIKISKIPPLPEEQLARLKV
jgi:tRNA U34 2-thiouridine synthase MnmA/TrmU